MELPESIIKPEIEKLKEESEKVVVEISINLESKLLKGQKRIRRWDSCRIKSMGYCG